MSLLCRCVVLLARNVSRGRRDALPLSRPPPPSYERLYGTHTVLSVLRRFAQPLPLPSTSSMTTTRTAADAAAATSATPVTPSPNAVGIARGRHPHRQQLSCLYVRDFSIEAYARHQRQRQQQQQQQQQQQRGNAPSPRHMVPPQYIAVHRIVALARALAVPVRFVPRPELVRLCGERRNQNVVLEVSSFVPQPLHDAAALLRDEDGDDDDTAAATTTTRAAAATRAAPAPRRGRTVLLLDHLLDPVNVGSILRSAFFYDVHAVVLSRDCVGCTPAAARTSTGALEHVRVYRARGPTHKFVQRTRRAFAAAAADEVGAAALHVIATTTTTSSATTTTTRSSTRAASPSTQSHGGVVHRLVVFGNESGGLTGELVRCCTHTLHIPSPQQAAVRARMALATAAPAIAAKAHSPSSPSVVEQHAQRERRLLRMSAREVTLNVNTACAVILSHLMSDAGGGVHMHARNDKDDEDDEAMTDDDDDDDDVNDNDGGDCAHE